MYLTADDQLQDEHIQPARYFSADLSMWFGPDLHKNKEKKVHETLALWFNQRSVRFNRLGFFWEDPKLSLGHVPVSDLIENIQPNQTKGHFFKKN